MSQDALYRIFHVSLKMAKYRVQAISSPRLTEHGLERRKRLFIGDAHGENSNIAQFSSVM